MPAAHHRGKSSLGNFQRSFVFASETAELHSETNAEEYKL